MHCQVESTKANQSIQLLQGNDPWGINEGISPRNKEPPLQVLWLLNFQTSNHLFLTAVQGEEDMTVTRATAGRLIKMASWVLSGFNGNPFCHHLIGT